MAVFWVSMLSASLVSGRIIGINDQCKFSQWPCYWYQCSVQVKSVAVLLVSMPSASLVSGRFIGINAQCKFSLWPYYWYQCSVQV